MNWFQRLYIHGSDIVLSLLQGCQVVGLMLCLSFFKMLEVSVTEGVVVIVLKLIFVCGRRRRWRECGVSLYETLNMLSNIAMFNDSGINGNGFVVLILLGGI